jgi:hypothetical protein
MKLARDINMNFDKEIYKTIHRSIDRGETPMCVKIYCSFKGKGVDVEMARKIVQYAQALENGDFSIFFAESQSPKFNDRDAIYGYSTTHLHNELDIDDLFESESD